jgi:GT2 family glycosyltransferase
MSQTAPPPGGQPLVTVVVLNYNGAQLLPACLDALAAQDLPEGQMAVRVVDNASGDGSVELLERDYPWVEVVRNQRNDGFAGGNNLAMRAATSEYLALINNDARPAPDWLRRLLEPLRDDPDGRLAATTAKIVFQPRFLPVRLATPPFIPGGLDGRELGVRIYRVTVDGRDVSDQVLWDRLAYAPEQAGPDRFRWTRPAGTLLVPVDPDRSDEPLRIGLRVAGETDKPIELGWMDAGTTVKAGPEPAEVEFAVPAGARLLDVLNNAGGMVFADGYGADRAYQELDLGQYDRPEEVFAFCGGAVCFRSSVLHEVGYFDEDFFMYYEDTDLSWRLRARGWSIRYQPSAVTRHLHAASSVEWSPLFSFHNDRNRLLLLTKNASAGLAVREVLRYPLTTVSLALRAVVRARHPRYRPSLQPTLLRLRVYASYLRLLPRMLARRRALAARTVVGRRALERWLVSRPSAS